MSRINAPDAIDAVYADPRVTDINPSARYAGETSTNGGRTWTPLDVPTVCGGHVQAEVATALLCDRDVTTAGAARTVPDWDGTLVRWTPAGGAR